MPVLQNADGSLAVVFKSDDTGREVYVTDDPRPQVTARGLSAYAYDTAEALAQDPMYRDLPGVPSVLFDDDVYGDSDAVRAFALLGWCRGQAKSEIDGLHPKVPKGNDRYVKPRRQRAFTVRQGTVTDDDGTVVVPVTTGSAPAGGSKRVPREPEPKSPETLGYCLPEHVVMRKDMLPRLSPELRKVFREMPDHLWVGRTVGQVTNAMSRKRGVEAIRRELMRVCWVPLSQIPADDSVAV